MLATGLRINVRAPDVLCAEFGGGNRKNPRAAAVVKHVVSGLCVGVKPLKAQVRRGVRTGTECHTGIKPDI